MQLGGRTLLAHALELAKTATGSAFIVGRTEKRPRRSLRLLKIYIRDAAPWREFTER